MIRPAPPRVQALLALEGRGSRSLCFDKSAESYASEGGPGQASGEWKAGFFHRFVDYFNDKQALGEEYHERMERRYLALEALDARSVVVESEERLLLGLGIPHVTETGFLLDRLTGCPYLPGSTVKGLLRFAAREVSKGAIEGSSFWADRWEAVFGTGPQGEAAAGLAIFFDSFPVSWPTLEVDVLTPHYGGYYSESEDHPGDWEDPVPVPFLTVAAGCRFKVWFRATGRRSTVVSAEAIEKELPDLLHLALEWFGAGGKTSAGYGFFRGPSELKMALTQAEVWEGARLVWNPGQTLLEAHHKGETAWTKDRAVLDALPGELKGRLKNKKKLANCRVEVTRVSKGWIDLKKVEAGDA